MQAEGETRPRESAGREWLPVLGPVDRVSFLDEQRRRRWETWRLLALCLVVVTITGVPQSAIITPLVLGITFLIARLANAPALVFDLFREAASTGYRSLDYLMTNLDRMPPLQLLRSSGEFLPGILLLLLPGAILSVLAWLGLCFLMFRAGVGSALLSLGAREPRLDDLEEQQLVNVVAEMAIAAGLPPPRVMLLDVDAANAVAIGSSPGNATVIVTRRLLDTFDRDETQGILAHLIASIGNGDLPAAMAVVAVFQTFGLFLSVLDAPFSPRARTALWRLARLSLNTLVGRPSTGKVQADVVGAMLLGSLAADSADDAGAIMEAGERPNLNPVYRFLLRARMFVLLPSLLLSLFMKMQQFLFVGLVLGPVIALTWRTRRYLADASAVQLTRYPDSIARGLRRLAADGGAIPGAAWASHLFVVGTEAMVGRSSARLQQEMAALRNGGASGGGAGQMVANWGEGRARVMRYAAEVSQLEKGTLSSSLAIMVSFHPPLHERLERLVAMGATSAPAQPRRGMPRLAMYLIIGPLLLLCGALMTIALGLVYMLALFADMMVITVVLIVVLTVLGVKV